MMALLKLKTGSAPSSRCSGIFLMSQVFGDFLDVCVQAHAEEALLAADVVDELLLVHTSYSLWVDFVVVEETATDVGGHLTFFFIYENVIVGQAERIASNGAEQG